MKTSSVMFILILCSFAGALILAYLGFRKIEFCAVSKIQIIVYSFLNVLTFAIVLNFLWVLSEEALIYYNFLTYGYEDTGSRYFYPGNSGMGYARGFSEPLDLILDIMFRSTLLATLIGLPLSWILKLKKK